MNFNGCSEKSSELPRGAEFHLCALQVNPHHYNETFHGNEAAGNAESHAKAIVAKAVELGVSVLAITDHNNVSGVEAFRNAADGYGITIFPGFELTSSEGVHVLCIYPPDTEKETLERYLGDFGIYETESTSDLSSQTFVEILKKVRTQKGITIAAHATNHNGLFVTLSGRARVKAWQSKDLLAIQIPGAVDELPQSVQQIVKNKNPDYQRLPAAGDNLAVTVVNAKDVVNSEDLENPSATCRIKMSEIGIDGLRQAFLDPGSRIRLSSDPPLDKHTELISLSCKADFWTARLFNSTRT